MTTRCAWCSPPGATTEPVSHGMCATCAASFGVDGVESLHDIPTDTIDRLPHGLILLDRAGHVTAYNKQEQRYSGRSPAAVIGRHFFREVAPCTQVQDFEGRYQALVETGGVSDEFLFVFHFADASRVMAIRLGFSAADEAGWIQVQQVS